MTANPYSGMPILKAAARKVEEARLASLNSASLHYSAGRSYLRPAEVASPLTANKNPHKAQTHVGPLSNWNRQNGNALDRYPTLPNGTREGCIATVVSANRTGKDAPANTGQAARRCAVEFICSG